jgi:hypothetical protein
MMWSPDRDQAIREQAMLAVRAKSVALLFEPLDIPGSKPAHNSHTRAAVMKIYMQVGGRPTDT